MNSSAHLLSPSTAHQRRQPKRGRPPLKTTGVFGTRESGGQIYTDDPNVDLRGLRRMALVSDEMLRTDAKIFGSYRHLRNTLLGATWSVEAAGGDALEKQIAEYWEQALGLGGQQPRMESSFETMIGRMIPFVMPGARYLEDLYYLDREVKGKAWLRGWADRKPEAHDRWEFNTKTGKLEAAVQLQWGMYPEERDPEPIPASKLILLVLNQVGQDYDGLGFMRPCYGPWRLKRLLLNRAGIAADRWASPVPVLKGDLGRARDSGLSDTDYQVAKEEGEETAQKFVGREQSYLVSEAGFEWSTFGEKAFDATSLLSMVDYLDGAMQTAWMTHFMGIGMGEQGSRSIGQVHESSFRRSTTNIMDQIADVIAGAPGPGRGTLQRLTRFNFGDVPLQAMPRLVHRGLGIDAFSEALPLMPSLIASKALTPGAELERLIRERIGVAPLQEESEPRPVDVQAGEPVDGPLNQGRPTDQVEIN